MRNWNKMKDTEIYGGGGNYLPWLSAKYKVQIIKSFTKETQRSGDAFIVEFEVLSSTTDEVEPGDTRSWFQGLGDQNIAFPSIKEFLVGVMRIDVNDKQQWNDFSKQCPGIMEEIGDEEWEKVSEPSGHLLNGLTVIIETIAKRTEKEDKPFTKHVWHAWEATEEELVELRLRFKPF